MIDVLVLENENIKKICNTVIDKIQNINIKYTKDLQKIKKNYDLYILFLSLDKDIIKQKQLFKTIGKNIIIFIENYNNMFLWNITNYFDPIDVILITISEDIIYERVDNNIKKIEREEV